MAAPWQHLRRARNLRGLCYISCTISLPQICKGFSTMVEAEGEGHDSPSSVNHQFSKPCNLMSCGFKHMLFWSACSLYQRKARIILRNLNGVKGGLSIPTSLPSTFLDTAILLPIQPATPILSHVGPTSLLGELCCCSTPHTCLAVKDHFLLLSGTIKPKSILKFFCCNEERIRLRVHRYVERSWNATCGL
jgi:hypothetical protein